MIRVLVVEDDPVAAEAHHQYVERVPGFEVAAVAASGAQALRYCEQLRIDVLLLDFYLPDMHGLEVCRQLRAAGAQAEVIAVTSARDLAVVRAAVSSGVAQYLLKPFTFASLREKLQRYARFREQASGAGQAGGQAEVDGMLATLRGPAPGPLPKGMSPETLDATVTALRVASDAEDGISAAALATETGMSRVTARRYLEYLADSGLARRRPHYGRVGRPEVRYAPVT